MRSLRDLHVHARHTVDRVLRRRGRRELIAPGTGGAVASGIVEARVVGFGAGNATFKCKSLDEEGQPTGDEFTVYALTYPVQVADLARCVPNVTIGRNVRIRRESNWIVGELVTGWFAVADFQQTGCTA